MTRARCDTPSKFRLLIRRGTDGRRWLDALAEHHVGYSLAQAAWTRDGDAVPRQLVEIHAAVVAGRISMALVTDLSGDVCDFARSDHTCCTRMCNVLHHRARGTVWDNAGLEARQVVSWEGALRAIGEIAVIAAIASGTNDPYQCDTFFGPRRWGKSKRYELPSDALSDRTALPTAATLSTIEPDARPDDLSRGELIHEAEAAIDATIAQLARGSNLRQVRPFHRRKHGPDEPIEFSDDPRFLGPADLVAPLAEEADAWLRHYERCRDEFRDRQDVAFPAGTIRFRRLGAACDPFKPIRRPPCPPRSKPFRGPPPPVWRGTTPAPGRKDRGPPG